LYDFIVIGSGFGGSVSALRLAEKGYSVAVLEAGKRFNDQDFPKSNWEYKKYFWAPLFRCFGILRLTPLSDAFIMSGTGVGGGSLGYGNTLLFPPDPFYNDPQWAGMNDWKTILSPFYQTAKKMLGVVRYEKITPADEIMKEIAEEMGRGDTFKMQDVGVFFGEPEKTVPDPYFDGKGPDRTGCNFCGGCFIGCRNNAKNTLVKNYLYLAEKLGVKVFPETKAKLIREKQGGGYEVETVRTTSLFANGGKRSFETGNLILAGGVLGTLDLLFKCKEQGALNRLSAMLGQRVRTNSEVVTSVTSKNKQIDFTEGTAITSSIYPDDVTHIEPMRYPDGSDAMNAIMTLFTGKGNRLVRPLKWLCNVISQPIEFIKTLWPFGLIKRSTIFLVMQTLDNSIRVIRKRRWWWPFSRKMVSQPETNRKRVPAYIQVAQDVTRAYAERVDGVPRNAVSEVLFDRGMTAHILGGCVIGPDSEKGVIDSNNRVYGYEGMYVVDGSMVPANLGVNPSLTITAMAEHAMSHIPNKEKG